MLMPAIHLPTIPVHRGCPFRARTLASHSVCHVNLSGSCDLQLSHLYETYQKAWRENRGSLSCRVPVEWRKTSLQVVAAPGGESADTTARLGVRRDDLR